MTTKISIRPTDYWVAWTVDPTEPRVVRAVRYGYTSSEIIGMFDSPELAQEAVACRDQIQRIAELIMKWFPDEPNTPDGAADVAVRLMRELHERKARAPWGTRLLDQLFRS